MKRLAYLSVGFILVFAGCTRPKADTIFQTSTIDALLAGVYDGNLTCRSLLKHGDFGVGTFNDLDGEMVVLDGKVYQLRTDGKVYRPDLSVHTPFASVCHFDPAITFPIDTLSDFAKVMALIDARSPNQNLIHAIRITGKFKVMRTRSVPIQSKPYLPLTQVVANQMEFQMENVTGTLIGFRFPAFFKGINMPGYHLHFLTSDLSQGGHVLSFELISGTCETGILHQFVLQLPEGDKAFAETDLSKDRSIELKKVEGGN